MFNPPCLQTLCPCADILSLSPSLTPFQARSFVEDSVSYLQSLFSPWDLPPAVFYHRNRMISKASAINPSA